MRFNKTGRVYRQKITKIRSMRTTFTAKEFGPNRKATATLLRQMVRAGELTQLTHHRNRLNIYQCSAGIQ